MKNCKVAKLLIDAKTIRRKDDKFETVFKVGRHCGITYECLTRGASNEIHICDSNMNGSYEREVIPRRYADTKLPIK